MRDGGVDAARDAGADTGPPRPDAGHDAGHDAGPPIDAGWTLLSGLPPRCIVTQADDTTLATMRYPVEPCPGSPTGCRQLVVDRTGAPYPAFRPIDTSGVFDGVHGILAVMRLIARPTRAIVQVLEDDGAVLAAWLAPSYAGALCDLDWIDSRDGRCAFSVGFNAGGGASATTIFGSSLLGPDRLAHAVATFGPDDSPGGFIQEVLASPDLVAAQAVPGDTVWRVGWDGTKTPVSSRALDGRGGHVDVVSGSAIFLFWFGAPSEIRVSVDRGLATTLIAPDGAEVGGVHTDGVDLVWLQGYGALGGEGFDRVELWTAPFAVTPATLHPRRVAVVPAHSVYARLRVGSGRAAFAESENDIGVYSLGDGARTVAHPPAGLHWTSGPLYLGTDELAVAVGISAPASFTVQFIRYDSLSAE